MGALFLSPIKILINKPITKSLARAQPHWCKKTNLVICERRESNICHATAIKEFTIVTPDEKVKKEIGQAYDGGIGIVRFLKGKVFFITGGTGFLAKVFIEKILRSQPDVDKIYLLIKAASKEEATKRLKNEVIHSEVFKNLEQIHGKSYYSFMLRKLIPVVGNVCSSNLGIETGLAEQIANGVDVIVNSAANTTFDERYHVALDVNTRGPSRLMSFAKTCKKLGLFLQVSTAYVNGQRKGKILEKPFQMGDTIARETMLINNASTSIPLLDVEAEIKLALDSKVGNEGSTVGLAQKMKQLGLERARYHGWQDTYVFTKAMGEMVINSMRGDIPVVIVRPSVIESTYREPFPGWIEGNRMVDPLITSNGKGKLNCFPYNPDAVLDVIPADMVVNATLAAMTKHGETKKPGIHIYHIGSSVVNPLLLDDMFTFIFKHFCSSPFVDYKGKTVVAERIKAVNSIDDFTTHMGKYLLQQSTLFDSNTSQQRFPKRLESICMTLLEKVNHLANIYEPYAFYEGRFDSSNIQKLFESLSKEEKKSFWFDIGSIDWKEYFCNIHIPGLRKHVMKEKFMC